MSPSRPFALVLGLVLAIPVAAQTAGAGRRALIHDGVERRYVVRIPMEVARRGAPVPLVLVLHGGGGNAENAERMTGFTALAEREGLIVVYPEGTGGRADRLLTWNATHCCGPAMERRTDDVGFIRALLDTMIARYPVDPRRIHATGLSNGGMMAHRLGIELADRLASIAPVIAGLFGDEPSPRGPVSALMINGMLDRSVPFEGGAPGGRATAAWDGTPLRPALDQGALWARANGCGAAPLRREEGSVVRWSYACPEGRAVDVLGVRDNGHAWPGGRRGTLRADRPSQALDATETIWRFFAAQGRPSPR